MSVKTENTDKVVEEALRQISHIATLPEVTLKIIELVEDPSSTAQDLHNVIQNDPALCSRVLKVVNSSFYGLPGQIASINRAIVLLGLNAVKNIAISASVNKLFRGGELASGFSGRNLWTHSITTAASAKLVAEQLKIGMSDEIFLSGLMHDIGMMVELQFDRHRFIEVIGEVGVNGEGVPSKDMREVERAIFEADHETFGAGICKKWKFPKSLMQVAGHHHEPLALPPDERRLASVVYVAERIAHGVDPSNFRIDLPDVEISSDVLDEIKLSKDAVEKVKEDLSEQLDDVMALMY